MILFFCLSMGNLSLEPPPLLLSEFMSLFSHISSFGCMFFVILPGNSSSLISITFFTLDGDLWLFSGDYFLSLSVSLFISESDLKSTLPSSTCCCCISSCVVSFLGLDFKYTLVPFPNICSSAALVIPCLLTSTSFFLMPSYVWHSLSLGS